MNKNTPTRYNCELVLLNDMEITYLMIKGDLRVWK